MSFNRGNDESWLSSLLTCWKRLKAVRVYKECNVLLKFCGSFGAGKLNPGKIAQTFRSKAWLLEHHRMTKSLLICSFFLNLTEKERWSLISWDCCCNCGFGHNYPQETIQSSDVDFECWQIELHTLDGLVKDSTQCAPNGYYFLPVYDKVMFVCLFDSVFYRASLLDSHTNLMHSTLVLQGKFLVKIKGPEGWSFEPNQVSTPISLLVIVCSPRLLLLLLGVFQTPLIVDLLWILCSSFWTLTV
jgi:hypothetical protein